jgi:hypothetical protein
MGLVMCALSVFFFFYGGGVLMLLLLLSRISKCEEYLTLCVMHRFEKRTGQGGSEVALWWWHCCCCCRKVNG